MTVTKLLGVSCRPPQIRTSSFRSCTRPSLLLQPLAASDFVLLWRLVRLKQPQIGFVYLGSSVCLQLPSDSASRRTPLLLANGWRSPAPVRDFHPRDDAHAGRTQITKSPLFTERAFCNRHLPNPSPNAMPSMARSALSASCAVARPFPAKYFRRMRA